MFTEVYVSEWRRLLQIFLHVSFQTGFITFSDFEILRIKAIPFQLIIASELPVRYASVPGMSKQRGLDP